MCGLSKWIHGENYKVKRPVVFIINTKTLLVSKGLNITGDSIVICSGVGCSLVDGWERLSALFISCKKLEYVVFLHESTVKISRWTEHKFSL